MFEETFCHHLREEESRKDFKLFPRMHRFYSLRNNFPKELLKDRSSNYNSMLQCLGLVTQVSQRTKASAYTHSRDTANILIDLCKRNYELKNLQHYDDNSFNRVVDVPQAKKHYQKREKVQVEVKKELNQQGSFKQCLQEESKIYENNQFNARDNRNNLQRDTNNSYRNPSQIKYNINPQREYNNTQRDNNNPQKKYNNPQQNNNSQKEQNNPSKEYNNPNREYNNQQKYFNNSQREYNNSQKEFNHPQQNNYALKQNNPQKEYNNPQKEYNNPQREYNPLQQNNNAQKEYNKYNQKELNNGPNKQSINWEQKNNSNNTLQENNSKKFQKEHSDDQIQNRIQHHRDYQQDNNRQKDTINYQNNTYNSNYQPDNLKQKSSNFTQTPQEKERQRQMSTQQSYQRQLTQQQNPHREDQNHRLDQKRREYYKQDKAKPQKLEQEYYSFRRDPQPFYQIDQSKIKENLKCLVLLHIQLRSDYIKSIGVQVFMIEGFREMENKFTCFEVEHLENENRGVSLTIAIGFVEDYLEQFHVKDSKFAFITFDNNWILDKFAEQCHEEDVKLPDYWDRIIYLPKLYPRLMPIQEQYPKMAQVAINLKIPIVPYQNNSVFSVEDRLKRFYQIISVLTERGVLWSSSYINTKLNLKQERSEYQAKK